MNVAISTHSLSDDTPHALERALELGFQTVEINLQADEFGYGYRRKPNARFYRELKAQLDQGGLNVWSVTVPQLTQRQMFSARARKDILLHSAGAAGILGAKVYSVEPAHIFTDEKSVESYFNDNRAPTLIDGFDETWAQVVNRRMTLAIGNMSYWLGMPLLNNAKRMARLTHDLGIGWSADLRRASSTDLAQWIDLCGERIAVAHVYDLAEDDETALTPEEAEWETRLASLAKTRLKTIVLHGHPNQDDDEFINSRQVIEGMISAEYKS